MEALAWAKNIMEISAVETVAETPWSGIWRLKSGPGTFYLKRTPPKLFIEAAVLKALRGEAVPEVVAENTGFNAFIMTSCGDVSLRTHMNGKADLGLLRRGLDAYIALQEKTAPRVDEFLRLGVHDHRDLQGTFEALLASGEVSESLRRKLDGIRLPALPEMPACLASSDFHDNNIVMNGDKLSIIDLGEVAVEHPLLSRAFYVARLAGRYGFNPRDLDATVPLHLAPLAGALADWRLKQAVGDDLETVARMKGRIETRLEEFYRSAASDAGA